MTRNIHVDGEITFTVLELVYRIHHKYLDSLTNTPETVLPTTILLQVIVGCIMRSSTSYASPSLLPCFPRAKKERNFFIWTVLYTVFLRAARILNKNCSHLLNHQNKAKKGLFNVNKKGRKKFRGSMEGLSKDSLILTLSVDSILVSMVLHYYSNSAVWKCNQYTFFVSKCW